MVSNVITQKMMALKFAQGEISFDELAKSLGLEEAKKIAYFVEIVQKSLKEGL